MEKNIFTKTFTKSALKSNVHQTSQQNCNTLIKKRKVQSAIVQQQISIYNWRMETQYNIFKILSFNIQGQINKETMISIQIQKENFYLQHLQQLSLSQSLYILQCCLIAMEKLMLKFGCFYVSQRMIGIVGKKCKVWINENFELNQIMRACQSEKQMILQLMGIIKRHSEKIFEEKVYEKTKNCQSFLKMHEFLWKFSYEERILIPPFISFDERKIVSDHGEIEFSKNQKKKKKVFFPSSEENIRQNEHHCSQIRSSEQKSLQNIPINRFQNSKTKVTKSVYFTLESQKMEEKLSFSQNLSVNNEFSYVFNPTLEGMKKCAHSMSQENVAKMKKIISEKMRKKIDEKNLLQNLGTVKSIGEVEDHEQNHKNEVPLKLSEYGKKIDKSLFQIEYPEEEMDDVQSFESSGQLNL